MGASLSYCTSKARKPLRMNGYEFKVDLSTLQGAKHVSLSLKADSNMSARVGCHVAAQQGGGGIGTDSDLDSS